MRHSLNDTRMLLRNWTRPILASCSAEGGRIRMTLDGVRSKHHLCTIETSPEEATIIGSALIRAADLARPTKPVKRFQTSDGYTLHLRPCSWLEPVVHVWVDSLDPHSTDLMYNDEDGWPVDDKGELLDGEILCD